MGKTKEPIRLRQRKTKTGLISLYLDIYIDGKRSYEYLKLYLVPEVTREDRAINKETLLLAETIRSKRNIELHNHEFGFRNEFEENANFIAYFDSLSKSKLRTDPDLGNNSISNWQSVRLHFQKYDHNIEKKTFKDITPKWVDGFKTYLLTKATTQNSFYECEKRPITQNTAFAYFGKLKACLNSAFRERLIRYNPAQGVGNICMVDSERLYLTIDEVRKLAETPCRNEKIRKAFLFSCLTGLRRSDIIKLKWGEVQQQDGFTRLIFKQKKTKGVEYLDINEQAAKLIGEQQGEQNQNVFEPIGNCSHVNAALRQWVAAAGINKTITFHCARHTFATMMLALGTDLYTVSKLLGHRRISTTQIYAKVLDKNKQAAVSNIPNLLPDDNSK